jgi:hypothetical protein
MRFDPDKLLAALPIREIRPVTLGAVRSQTLPSGQQSALGEAGEYNGFTAAERTRTAALSKRLVARGATHRAATCDVCNGTSNVDEHAENYYDLCSWIGLCRSCHRNLLHKRFARPERWAALLDAHELPACHWARLVSRKPFDLAHLLRQRGIREPTLADFAVTNSDG